MKSITTYNGQEITLKQLGTGMFASPFEKEFFVECEINKLVESEILSHLDSEYLFNILQNNIQFYKHINHEFGDCYVLKFNNSCYEFYLEDKEGYTIEPTDLQRNKI